MSPSRWRDVQRCASETDRTERCSGRVSEPSDMSAALWDAVDTLLADVPVERIRRHKLGPLAARLCRRTGRPVAPALAADERGAAAAVVMARPLLEQIRSLCDGELALAKRPEVAR